MSWFNVPYNEDDRRLEIRWRSKVGDNVRFERSKEYDPDIAAFAAAAKFTEKILNVMNEPGYVYSNGKRPIINTYTIKKQPVIISPLNPIRKVEKKTPEQEVSEVLALYA